MGPKWTPKSSQKWSRQGFRTCAPYFQIRGPILGPFWVQKRPKKATQNSIKNQMPKNNEKRRREDPKYAKNQYQNQRKNDDVPYPAKP